MRLSSFTSFGYYYLFNKLRFIQVFFFLNFQRIYSIYYDLFRYQFIPMAFNSQSVHNYTSFFLFFFFWWLGRGLYITIFSNTEFNNFFDSPSTENKIKKWNKLRLWRFVYIVSTLTLLCVRTFICAYTTQVYFIVLFAI